MKKKSNFKRNKEAFKNKGNKKCKGPCYICGGVAFAKEKRMRGMGLLLV